MQCVVLFLGPGLGWAIVDDSRPGERVTWRYLSSVLTAGSEALLGIRPELTVSSKNLAFLHG
jgi:hypothetical protein